MISLSSRGAEGLGSAADLEDPARSGPVERMSAPAEFHRSGVVVHHQDFCAPSGLRCEPEAALDPAALERRGRVRAVPASAGTFGDTYGTVVLRGHVKHLGGAMFPGQWFGSSGSYVTKAWRRYARTERVEAALPGSLIIRLRRLSFLVQVAATALTPRNSRTIWATIMWW